MGVKVIIANNDILYNSLSNMALKNNLNIEIINVPTDKLNSFICQIKTRDKVIILDSTTSVTFCINILENAINRIGEKNIIILVVDSNNITNVINQKHQHYFFRKKNDDFSLLDVINVISDSLKNTIKLERTTDDILWKLGFTSYFKGTSYLKDAILLSYNNRDLLKDSSLLIKKVSEKNNISNFSAVRSDMDKSLNNMLNYTDSKIIYDIFQDDYDGRKISLKYFIDLCVHHLEKQKYLCLK